MQIGSYVHREGGKTWHLVESTIAGAAITKCGRRMERQTRRGYRLEAIEPREGGVAIPGPVCPSCNARQAAERQEAADYGEPV